MTDLKKFDYGIAMCSSDYSRKIFKDVNFEAIDNVTFADIVDDDGSIIAPKISKELYGTGFKYKFPK